MQTAPRRERKDHFGSIEEAAAVRLGDEGQRRRASLPQGGPWTDA